jgi:benzoyl-CoA reductase/2-hydroxyglutaryl-CoA dehydratase subunit BcrC/BadD/HgdB
MNPNAKILIAELAKEVVAWPEILKGDKNRGTNIIGFTGRYIPEELIHSAGARSYPICRGGEPEPPDAVLPYMLRFMSPFARAQIGYHLMGIDPVLPMLDLIVAQCNDCHMARLADLFEYFQLPTMKIGVPSDWDKSISQDYYQRGLVRLRQRLEEITGNSASDERLSRSIDSFNKMRDTLGKIAQLRKRIPPPIGGYDFVRLNHFSFFCDVEEMNRRLGDIHEAVKKERGAFPEEAPRILLAGHLVAMGDYVVLNLIENAGGVVVAELLDEGIRHHQWKVKTDGDLMTTLTETYYKLRTPPSRFNYAWRKRIERMEELIEEFHVDGMVWYQLSFDEIYSLESSLVGERMGKMGIPFLKLESSYEYAREAMGPLTTRVESFIQSIKNR